MFDYGEACPVSMATTVLCERWTLQIIRELFLGAHKYSEIQKFIPNISPTLLKNRLRMLEDNGVIMRKKGASANRYEYYLTPSGKALGPLLTEFGKWGMRYANDGMTDKQNTIYGFMRDISGALDVDELPACDMVIQFNFSDEPDAKKQYINIRDGKAQVCTQNLGFDVDVYITASLSDLTKIWYGELSITRAIDEEKLIIVADPIYTGNLTKWLKISSFADGNPMFVAP